jgi:hypothetical protein
MVDSSYGPVSPIFMSLFHIQILPPSQMMEDGACMPTSKSGWSRLERWGKCQFGPIALVRQFFPILIILLVWRMLHEEECGELNEALGDRFFSSQVEQSPSKVRGLR